MVQNYFIEKVKAEIGKVIPGKKPLAFESGDSFSMPLNNNDLKLKAIYGKEYRKLNDLNDGGGINNVALVIQCNDVDLQRRNGDIKSNELVLNCNHVLKSGDMATGDYEPVFFANYRNKRKDFTIPNARFFVYTAKRRVRFPLQS